MNTFFLKVIASDKVFFSGKAEMVNIPTLDGEKVFLAHHENIVIAIEMGDLKFRTEDGETHHAVVGKGFAQVINNRVTVLVDSAERPEDIDKIMGLNLGGDDYVTKPFVPMELMARVRSHLRRYGRYLDATAPKESDSIYLCGGLELNVDTKTVSVDGKKVKVTPIEFKILELLMKNAGKVFSADDIYERVWNEEAINSETVMVHVRNLREKIEINPKKPQYLKVVWGVGYKIDKQ